MHVTEQSPKTYGSDVLVDVLLRMGIDHLSINPSATLRGLHDTAVNSELGAGMSLVLCCHEEIAVAVAHGYAKTAGKPMAVAVGNIVGLQHASMAIYNAWSDRVPMLVLSGAGPLDAASRRPHVDWVHATVDQGRIVSDVVKWNDQPLSIGALVPSLVKGHRLATAKPMAPVHFALDTSLQEQPAELWSSPLPDQYATSSHLLPHPEDLSRAVEALASAQRPLIMVGRVEGATEAVTMLAETLRAPVIDIGQRLGIRGGHRLDLSDCRESLVAMADMILALEVKDLHGRLHTSPDPTTRQIRALTGPETSVIRVGLDELVSSGYGQFQYQPADIEVIGEPEAAVSQLVVGLAEHPVRDSWSDRDPWWEESRQRSIREWTSVMEASWDSSPVSSARLAHELGQVLAGRPWVLAHNQLGPWPNRLWNWDGSTRFLGLLQFAAVALGYGPGVATGAGIAAKTTGETVVSIDGDGDFLYTPSALWTAANQKVPVLFVVLNNGAYGVDIHHQLAIAKARGRSTEYPEKGLELDSPPVRFSELAKSFGVFSEAAVDDPGDLNRAFATALTHIDDGHGPALVEVVTQRY